MVFQLLPSALERLVEPDGRLSPIWYRFFFQQIKGAKRDFDSLSEAISTGDADVSAAVTTERSERVTADEAAAARIDTVEAAYQSADAALSASIVTEQTARVSADGALAAQISTVSTTVAGHTASIAVQQASIDGLKLQYGVALSLDQDVVGFFRLDGGDTGSTFTLGVDTFRVVKRGVTGGDPVNVFEIGEVGGTPAIVMREPLIADEGIVARMIRAGTITADKIDVTELSAVSENVGMLTAGKIQSATGKMVIDLDAGTLVVTT